MNIINAAKTYATDIWGYCKMMAPRCFKWVKLDLLTAKMIVGYAL
jgi:hypothetical protein